MPSTILYRYFLKVNFVWNIATKVKHLVEFKFTLLANCFFFILSGKYFSQNVRQCLHAQQFRNLTDFTSTRVDIQKEALQLTVTSRHMIVLLFLPEVSFKFLCLSSVSALFKSIFIFYSKLPSVVFFFFELTFPARMHIHPSVCWLKFIDSWLCLKSSQPVINLSTINRDELAEEHYNAKVKLLWCNF